jgi:hypothetical protein
MNRLTQFWRYVSKVFDLPQRLAGVRAQRPLAEIPTRVLTSTLLSGTVLRIHSLLDLQTKTEGAGWQRLHGWTRRISDDALAYGLERYNLADLRSVLAPVIRQLKLNKQLEECRVNGLLCVALDANEQFHSRSRCCDQCSQRLITIKNAAGEEERVREYYHRQVYARLCGPKGALLLDLEPVQPGEEECQAALRLLGRLRRLYGPRFFDAVTVDAWYARGPWIRAVQKLGWGVVCVLKQKDFEIYRESDALRPKAAHQTWKEAGRVVELREVKHLSFTEVRGEVRVVLSDEAWQETKQVGGRRVVEPKQSHWRWLVTEELAPYGARVIHQLGHGRWGIENQGFNVLTQHYHLTHCVHHHPEAILAWLLFLILGYVLFDAFARIHGKLLDLSRWTFKAIVDQLRGGLERPEELEPLWSG